MKFYCKTCKADRDDGICPVCLEETVEANGAEVYAGASPAGSDEEYENDASNNESTGDGGPRSGPVDNVERKERPSARSHAAPDLPTGRTSAGQDELEQYLADGYEVYLIAGVQGTGKTQLLSAYQGDAFLAQVHKNKDGGAIPTRQNRLDCLTVHVDDRPVIFVDTAGENFRQLHPLHRYDGEVPEEAVDFLRLISRRLSGVVLLLSLDVLWADQAKSVPGLGHKEQEDILKWVLMLLRWLQEDGTYPGGAIPFQRHVDREVKRERRRLRVPVLTLFSRADELVDLTIPARRDRSWLRDETEPRKLKPLQEDPLLLAHHRLPKLITALQTHADHFRIDFVHSLYEDPDTGVLVEDGGCGLSSSLAWLLDPAWRSRLPSIPTRWWLALDQRLRPDRWRRLPAPRPLQ